MRIDQVRADAFGPLRNARLELSPGITVIHGLNEAGKSSWFAATYAGLVGRRKARGRGTIAQADFARRHKPWSGSQWRAGVTLTLDNGTVLALEHDLVRGEARMVDTTNRRPLSLTEVERRLGLTLTTDGTLDGARILGLTRDNVRATIFVAQADILRVLQEAGELQELLERVATSGTADVTSEAALQWLNRTRQERVGSPHIGNRPLRAATLAVERARDSTTAARDDHGRLLQVLAEQRDVDRRRYEAARHLDRLQAAQQWKAVLERQHRIDQIRKLEHEATAEVEPAADVAVVRRVSETLGAYHDRGEAPVAPDGPDAAAIQAELDDLPEKPVGDLEPQQGILLARDALTRARAAWGAHQDSAPATVTAPDIAASPEELRQLAAHLAEPEPEVDQHLQQRLDTLRQEDMAARDRQIAAEVAYREATERNQARQRDFEAKADEYRREQHQYAEANAKYDTQVEAQSRARGSHLSSSRSARRTGTVLVISGIALAVIGALLTVLLGVVGLIAVAIAIGLALTGIALGRRVPRDPDLEPLPPRPMAPNPPRAPDFESVSPPSPVVPDPVLPQLELELVRQRTAHETYEQTRRKARERLGALGVPDDPDELQRVARALDDAGNAAERASQHAARARELGETRRIAAHELARLLALGVPDGSEEGRDLAVLDAYDEYASACRNRAQQAASAARRPALEETLRQRRERELEYARAVKERERRERAILEVSAHVGIPPGRDAVETAQALHAWVAEQERRRARDAEARERSGRLEQLLDGETLDSLEQEQAVALSGLGPEPEPIPPNLEGELELWERRHHGLIGKSGDLRGQQSQLTASLPSIAQLLEQEAEAERALERVQEISRGLDTAVDQLEQAKMRSHANVAPAIEHTVRPWIPLVTQGRYLDVKVNPSDLTMKVTEFTGAARDAHLLSHGTTEQLYLLLRMALARHLTSIDESAPLILDDVTAHSDRTRTQQMLTLLQQISRNRQVVMFTQEDDILEWADNHLVTPPDSVVRLPKPPS